MSYLSFIQVWVILLLVWVQYQWINKYVLNNKWGFFQLKYTWNKIIYLSIDENIMAKGSKETKFVFLLEEWFSIHYSLFVHTL